VRLSEESVVVVCPNPKCRREIGKPILLTVLSVTPPKEYEACPYCFTDLTPEPQIEKENVPEPTVEAEERLDEAEETASTSETETSLLEKVKPSPSFLKRVKSWIPRAGNAQKEERQLEEPKAEPIVKEEEKRTEEEPETEPDIGKEPEEAPKTEPAVKAEPKEVPETELADKKEDECSGCPGEFGYLANRPPDTPIPPQCLVCPKMVDCMLCPRESDE